MMLIMLKQNTSISIIPIFTKVENVRPDSKILVEIVQTKMPFGKYKGTLVSDIPVSYLEWMHNKGFPPGKLGMMLATVYEIKTNGLTEILFKVKRVLKG
jgi:uncharacterized protein (DUF3820 family)